MKEVEEFIGVFGTEPMIALEDALYRHYSGLLGNYDEVDRLPPLNCLGDDMIAVVALVDVDCLFFGTGFSSSVNRGTEWRGRRANAIEIGGFFPGGPDEDDLGDISYRLFIDGDSFLPLGRVVEFTYLYEEPRLTQKTTTTFEVEFLPANSLARELFDSMSLGYEAPDVMAELDAFDGRIYWLGQHFPASNGFPGQTLDSTSPPSHLDESGAFMGVIHYRPGDDEFGGGLFGNGVSLHEYQIQLASDFLRTPTASLIPGECLAEEHVIELADGVGYIWGVYRGPEEEVDVCPPPTQFEAKAYIDTTIVSIVVAHNTGHPFDSVEGMEHLLRGLRPKD